MRTVRTLDSPAAALEPNAPGSRAKVTRRRRLIGALLALPLLLASVLAPSSPASAASNWPGVTYWQDQGIICLAGGTLAAKPPKVSFYGTGMYGPTLPNWSQVYWQPQLERWDGSAWRPYRNNAFFLRPAQPYSQWMIAAVNRDGVQGGWINQYTGHALYPDFAFTGLQAGYYRVFAKIYKQAEHVIESYYLHGGAYCHFA